MFSEKNQVQVKWVCNFDGKYIPTSVVLMLDWSDTSPREIQRIIDICPIASCKDRKNIVGDRYTVELKSQQENTFGQRIYLYFSKELGWFVEDKQELIEANAYYSSC